MHEYFHTKFGFCLWDVGALIVLAAMVAVLVIHIIRQKKRESDFEDELSAQMTEQQSRPARAAKSAGPARTRPSGSAGSAGPRH